MEDVRNITTVCREMRGIYKSESPIWFTGLIEPNGGREGCYTSVHRVFGSGPTQKLLRGDGDGLWFPDRHSANQFLYERGYTQRFFRGPWCPKCRKVHMEFGHRSGWCRNNNELVN